MYRPLRSHDTEHSLLTARCYCCSFDSTYMYEYTLIMLFNLVFTSLPVAALGIVSRISSILISSLSKLTNTRSAARPRRQRKVLNGLSSTLPTRYSRSRMDSRQVLRVHARRTLPIWHRLLHPVPRLHLVAITLGQRSRPFGVGVRYDRRSLRLHGRESLCRAPYPVLVVDRLRRHHRVNPLVPRLDRHLLSI